tara:strand:+ start:698 stop:865 length:168 start_codon:yes stop_codon:yes gene_type:complete
MGSAFHPAIPVARNFIATKAWALVNVQEIVLAPVMGIVTMVISVPVLKSVRMGSV